MISRTVAFLHTMALVLSAVALTVVAPLAGVSAEDFVTLDLPGATVIVALGINDAGQIVGEYRDAEGKSHSFLLEKGAVTPVETAEELLLGRRPGLIVPPPILCFNKGGRAQSVEKAV